MRLRGGTRDSPAVFVVHGTRKFLDRVKDPVATSPAEPTTALGNWYGTVLMWRPQVALFVNEPTLLPVLLPFAPGATVISRFAVAAARILAAHELPRSFIDHEQAQMNDYQVTETKNRSVVGIMNEFTFLARA